MILFYCQIKNPDSKDKKRFQRIKNRIGREFKRMKKANEKVVSLGYKKAEKLVMKSGDNWLAIHQFRAI
ncbi:unnamed protein product [marine sediment metagenome]|uniref:Uncharacterized protein n=1 Tax=marine sediment metagenome TaxID=412755 RepID=X1R4R1_9ZZZZ